MNYFLNNFKEWKRKNIKKSMTLEPSYFYWCNTLIEYVVNLFKWDGLPETIPPHEIEMACICHGYGTFVKLPDNTWIAPFENSRNGITDYVDMFNNVQFTTPLHFGNRTFGKNAVLVPNTPLKMPLLPKIQRYSTILAHIDVSLIVELVNDRNSVLFEAITGKQAGQAKTYQDRLYHGEFETLINQGFQTIRTTDLNKRSNGELEKIIIARNKIFQAFLEEIGIKKTNEKKERMISDEATADDEMLAFNISDMFECRKKSAIEFNNLSGFSVSVNPNYQLISDLMPESDNTKEKEEVTDNE